MSVESTPRLEVGQQTGDREVCFHGMLGVVLLQVAVRVPGVGVLHTQSSVEQLHEADATLDQAARHETLSAERLGDFLVEAVELFGGV